MSSSLAKGFAPRTPQRPVVQSEMLVLDFVTRSGGVGNVKWSVVAAQVKGRLGKQVRERWYNHLDPTLKKCPWEKSEDELLLKLQATLGNRWCEIAKNIPGRSENAVKNRWNSAQRRAKAAKDAAARKEMKSAEAASAGTAGGTKKKKRKKSVGTARGSKLKGKGRVASELKKRKASCAAQGGSRRKKKGRKTECRPRNSAAVPKTKPGAATTADLSVMADIGTALQMCEMRANSSPDPSPTTRPATPPTLNSRAQQAVNITAANILAGAFERVTPGNRVTSMCNSKDTSSVEDVAASALLGPF